MIIRILGEGQFDVPDEAVAGLNDLDAAVESSVDSGDEAAFTTALASLLAGVRANAARHEDGTLDTSDLILPPADATLEEVRDLLSDDGLIPG
jgi:hypothetical protein